MSMRMPKTAMKRYKFTVIMNDERWFKITSYGTSERDALHNLYWYDLRDVRGDVAKIINIGRTL